ncbi:MAG: hypothetical protein BroJett033_7930 [Chloroflexota bacterium]|nr:MAG: hypothetical protein BroJett033_7930 [Chloroflexota bacterium]
MAIYNRTKTVTKALTVATTAYTANDVVGGLIEIDVASAGGGGVVGQVELVDDANQKEPYILYLFRGAPTLIADDAAFAPTVADLKLLCGAVPITAGHYTTLNSNAWAQTKDLNIWYTTDSGKLYGYLVAQDTPDYAAAEDLTLIVTVWAD